MHFVARRLRTCGVVMARSAGMDHPDAGRAPRRRHGADRTGYTERRPGRASVYSPAAFSSGLTTSSVGRRRPAVRSLDRPRRRPRAASGAAGGARSSTMARRSAIGPGHRGRPARIEASSAPVWRLERRPEPLGEVEVVLVVARVEGQRLVVGRLGDDVAVLGHAGPGRDQLADDDVLLEPLEAVVLALDRGFGEHPGRLLEGGGRQPRLGRERGLGDSHELGTTLGRALALGHEPLVHVRELAGVGLLTGQELRVARAPTRRRGAASGGRSPRRACRGSTRPAPGTPSGPRRRGTAGWSGCRRCRGSSSGRAGSWRHRSAAHRRRPRRRRRCRARGASASTPRGAPRCRRRRRW